MDAETFVLNIIISTPKKSVRGKKRLQKLCFFAKEFGVDADVNFRIHDFGPYSSEVSNAAEVLSFFGHVSEKDEPVGIYQRFVTVYSADEADQVNEKIGGDVAEKLSRLDSFTSIELEVASTIRYFVSREGKEISKAIECTKEIKPTKTTDTVLKRAISALEAVNLS